MRRLSGFTVLELVVVFGLVMVLLALVTMYFVKGQNYVADTEAYSSVQREASQIVRRMKEQLNRSTALHMQSDSPDHVYFLSYRDDDPGRPLLEFDLTNDQIIWKKWLCFYHDAEKREIVQAEIPLNSPSSNLTDKPAPDVDLGSFQAVPGKTIGQRVSALSLDKIDKTLVISLTVSGRSPVPMRTQADQLVEMRLLSQVTLTN